MNGPPPDSGERAVPSTARAPYSNEAARGWLPWAALTPVHGILFVVFAWLSGVERRSLGTIGLVRGSGVRMLLRGHPIGIATSCAVVGAIGFAGASEAHGFARAFHSPRALVEITILLLGFTLQSSAEESCSAAGCCRPSHGDPTSAWPWFSVRSCSHCSTSVVATRG